MEVLFDQDTLKKKLEQLESSTTKDGFWDNSEESTKVLQQIKELKNKLDKFNNVIRLYEDTELLVTMGIEEQEESMIQEAKQNYKGLVKAIEKLEIETLLSGKYDKNNAIISLHPGAGGTESQDWAEMLYRMYTRWANKNGFEVKEIDYLAGDEAGIKSVTAIITGTNAYGYLKCEKGVHRLIRISPFGASGRRHTSFASLEVVTEITDDI